MPKINLVIVEDHQVLREGLRALLERELDVTVVGEAGTGLKVADLVEQLRPEILLLDLRLPDLSGLEVLRQVRQRTPTTRVLILSMYSNEAYVKEAFRQGAAGYCLKTAKAEEVIGAVRAVAAGKRYLSPPLTDWVIEAYAQRASPPPDAYETLTTREREVLHLAAEGHSNSEIASRLGIGPRTVQTHRSNLMRKLKLRHRADLVRYAIRRGLILG